MLISGLHVRLNWRAVLLGGGAVAGKGGCLGVLAVVLVVGGIGSLVDDDGGEAGWPGDLPLRDRDVARIPHVGPGRSGMREDGVHVDLHQERHFRLPGRCRRGDILGHGLGLERR